MSTDEEDDILEGFLQGIEPEVVKFFELYGGIIKKAIGSVGIKDHALTTDDLFSECVKILLIDDKKAIRSFKGLSRLSTYIFTICFRNANKLMQKGILPGPDPDTLGAPDLLIEAIGEQKLQIIEETIALCKPREQVFIRMLFFDECSTLEIREFFGWESDATVYSQKNKIINKLKKIIHSACCCGK